METVNRASVVVEATEPFLAWARLLEISSPIDAMSHDDLTSVFLVNADGDDFDRAEILRRHWHVMFDEQLFAWHTDQRGWPKNRTLDMFHKWFDVRVVDLVYDLGNEMSDHND